MASSAAPLPAPDRPGSVDLAPETLAEQARDFHFAVTWVTLFAHLDPIQATGPRPRVQTAPPALAVVPVVAAPLMEQRAERGYNSAWQNAPRENTAWEMVVPKMIRTGPRSFLPAAGAEPGAKKPERL